MVQRNPDLEFLLTRTAKGDEVAFKALYDAVSPIIYRFVLARLGDEEAANTLTADVMIAVWQQAAQYAGRAAVTTWILGIANNKILSWRRARVQAHKDVELDTVQPERSLEEALLDHSPTLDDGADEALARDRQRLLDECLKQLPPSQRQTLYLALVEGYAYAEIATILGCPENTVKTRVFNGRRQLQKCLQSFLKD